MTFFLTIFFILKNMTETEDDQSNPSFKKTKVQTNEKFRHKLDIHLN